jgi:citrate synthase
LSSTAARPLTLKERLAELIPVEKENVCIFMQHGGIYTDVCYVITGQVKHIRAEHGKKAFGPVIVDQLYG